MTTVTLQGVRKSFLDRGREHVVVHDLDLSVEDGEFLVLVGPSGCGKSTTLRMIAGLETVSAGTIRIGDRVVNDVPAKDRDIAMVFQNYALYPHMTVRQNLGFALELRKLPKSEVEARVRTAAEMLGLDQLLDRRPKQLSGGQRQRVALGRAIVRNPQVFLFDEPLSNLDAKLRVETRRQIAALRRKLGATTIYVTHDQVEAMTLGDRIVVMKDGRVQQVDPPLSLYRRPTNTFVATFVGSPPMNLLRGTVAASDGPVFTEREGGWRIPVAGPVPEPGRDVIFGVRPEDLSIGLANGGPAGRVEEVEPLGSETLAFVRHGPTILTVRLEGGTLVERGQLVDVQVRPGAVHWFDGVTEARLG